MGSVAFPMCRGHPAGEAVESAILGGQAVRFGQGVGLAVEQGDRTVRVGSEHKDPQAARCCPQGVDAGGELVVDLVQRLLERVVGR
ncbi:hypothetical protein [Streptomyces shenzhenensis]|uniref:hypothetical protein n=1 Tax=Streptomyces shenzhenensis TaxID=943815 RepID=UPI003695880C